MTSVTTSTYREAEHVYHHRCRLPCTPFHSMPLCVMHSNLQVWCQDVDTLPRIYLTQTPDLFYHQTTIAFFVSIYHATSAPGAVRYSHLNEWAIESVLLYHWWRRRRAILPCHWQTRRTTASQVSFIERDTIRIKKTIVLRPWSVSRYQYPYIGRPPYSSFHSRYCEHTVPWNFVGLLHLETTGIASHHQWQTFYSVIFYND